MKNPNEFEDLLKAHLSRKIAEIAKAPERFSAAPGAFTRNRKWGIENLFKVLCRMDNHNLYTNIQNMLGDLEGVDHSFTLPGFTQQRDKLTLPMFEYLHAETTRFISTSLKKQGQLKTYKGYHVTACDGADFPLPTECIPSEPDADPHRKAQHRLLHLNVLYDVSNGIYVIATMKPKLECSERSELLQMASSLAEQKSVYRPRKTIIVCDRGYESLDVFVKLSMLKYKFVIRLKSAGRHGLLHRVEAESLEDNKFVDRDITFHCKKGRDGVYKSTKSLVNSEKFTYRLVAFKLENGNTEYLLTNLPREKISSGDIAAIYRKRWDIEVSFRHQKYGLGSIVFHSKKLNAQQMELYTALTLYNCISAIVQHTNIPSKKRKKGYIINFTVAVAVCLDYLFREIEIEVEKILSKNLVRSKRGRSYPRNVGIRRSRGFFYRAN